MKKLILLLLLLIIPLVLVGCGNTEEDFRTLREYRQSQIDNCYVAGVATKIYSKEDCEIAKQETLANATSTWNILGAELIECLDDKMLSGYVKQDTLQLECYTYNIK